MYQLFLEPIAGRQGAGKFLVQKRPGLLRLAGKHQRLAQVELGIAFQRRVVELAGQGQGFAQILDGRVHIAVAHLDGAQIGQGHGLLAFVRGIAGGGRQRGGQVHRNIHPRERRRGGGRSGLRRLMGRGRRVDCQEQVGANPAALPTRPAFLDACFLDPGRGVLGPNQQAIVQPVADLFRRAPRGTLPMPAIGRRREKPRALAEPGMFLLPGLDDRCRHVYKTALQHKRRAGRRGDSIPVL